MKLLALVSGAYAYQMSTTLGSGSISLDWSDAATAGATYEVTYQIDQNEDHDLFAPVTDTTTDTDYTVTADVGTVFAYIQVSTNVGGNVTEQWQTGATRVGGAAAYWTDHHDAGNSEIFQGRLMVDGTNCMDQLNVAFACPPMSLSIYPGSADTSSTFIAADFSSASVAMGQGNIKAYAKIQAIFNTTDDCHIAAGTTVSDIFTSQINIVDETVTLTTDVTDLPMNVTMTTSMEGFPDVSRPWVVDGVAMTDANDDQIYLNNATFVAFTIQSELDGYPACTPEVTITMDADCNMNSNELVGLVAGSELTGGSVTAAFDNYWQNMVSLVGDIDGASIEGACTSDKFAPTATMSYAKFN